MAASLNSAVIEAARETAPIRDLFGFELVDYDDRSAVFAIPHRPELGHIPGYFQGTVITAIGEVSAALAAIASLPEGRMSATVDQTIKFIGAARGERLIGRGQVLKPSLSLVACKADIFVERDGKEHLIATMLQSNIVLPE